MVSLFIKLFSLSVNSRSVRRRVY